MLQTAATAATVISLITVIPLSGIQSVSLPHTYFSHPDVDRRSSASAAILVRTVEFTKRVTDRH